MQTGGREVPDTDNFQEMLQGADLGEFLDMADEYIPEETLSDEMRTAFDAVGSTWAEKALVDGKHLAAVFIASASCRQETIVKVAKRCLDAHTDATDVERVLIWREMCGLSSYLGTMQ